MLFHILFLTIEFLIHTSLLLLCLWIMVKLQDLNYTFLGLLGSAALGSGLDMIPYFGHILAVPALYFCVWKVTQASMFPDAAFTVVVAYALVFAANMFIIGSLMGDLRPSHKAVAGNQNQPQEMADESSAAAKTNQPVPAAATNLVLAGDAKLAQEIARQFLIKGVTRNTDKSAVTILSGKKTYTIFLGQLVSVQTTDGLVSVRFTDLGKDWVTLKIRGTQVKCAIPPQ